MSASITEVISTNTTTQETGFPLQEQHEQIIIQADAAWKDTEAALSGVAWKGGKRIKSWAKGDSTLLPLQAAAESVPLGLQMAREEG